MTGDCSDRKPGRELKRVYVHETGITNHVHPGHQLPAFGSVHQGIAEILQANPQALTPNKPGHHGVRPAELGLIPGFGQPLGLDGFANGTDGRRGHLQDHGVDVPEAKAAMAQGNGGVDAGVGEMVGRIRLVKYVLGLPAVPQIADDCAEVGLVTEKGSKQPESTFDCRRRTGNAPGCELGGGYPGPGGPTAVEPLDGAPRPVGLDDPAGHAASDAHGVSDAIGIGPQQPGGRGRRSHRPAYGGGVLAPLEIHRLAGLMVVTAHTQAHGYLQAHRHGIDQRGTCNPSPFPQPPARPEPPTRWDGGWRAGGCRRNPANGPEPR